jgi:hypothetical protein
MAKATHDSVSGPGEQKVRETFQRVSISNTASNGNISGAMLTWMMQVFQQYKGMIQDFDGFLNNLSPTEQEQLRKLYLV